MPESLSKSFSNLKVILTSLLIGLATNVLKKVTARPKIQVELPKNIGTDGRVCFYGYDVGMEWLIEYATANWCWGPIENKHYDDLSKASGAIKILRARSGIKQLLFESALVDHTVPADTVTIPGYRGKGELIVPIISIFSDEGPSFRKRPSQEQVDRLSEIIGKRPRWWADYEDPQTYGY